MSEQSDEQVTRRDGPLAGGLAFGLDPVGLTHLGVDMRGDTDDALDMPLCFVAYAHQSGATAAELNLTFDQALDEDDYPRTDDRTQVSCPDCREQIHA